jgi:predicted permease
MIMSYLNLIQLSTLASAYGNGEAQAHLRHRVEVLTARAQLKGRDVVRMLRATGSVIGGAGVLLVGLPMSFSRVGVDFFCPCDRLNDVVAFLQSKSYGAPEPCRVPSMQTTRMTSFALRGVVKAILRLTHKSTGFRVFVIQSETYSSLPPIFAFPSTVSMNWISWDGVHCAYPNFTMNYQGAPVSIHNTMHLTTSS